MANNQAAPATLKPENSFKRLPSFKSPRDLKLSQFSNPVGDTRTKKVFVPNLNVQRRKPNEAGEGGGSCSDDKRPERGGRRERGRSERGRPKKEYIQQGNGVFAEGLASSLKSRSGRSFSSQEHGTSGSGSSRARFKLKALDIKAEKEEEDLIMKELLRDDFLDDPDVKTDDGNSPVKLPLTKMENLKIEPTKEETFSMSTPDYLLSNGLKIKTEPDVEEIAKRPESSTSTVPLPKVDELKPITTAELLAQSHSTEFIFFQIPNSIPRLKVPETAPFIPSKPSKKEKIDEESEEKHSLKSLPPGKIGTLQILKSGKTRLLLGDVKHHLEPATQVAFKQELVSVDLNKSDKSGNIISLGKLSTRMLVTPDWNALLSRPP